MPYTIRDPLSWPITIPDVGADGSGLMTPALLAELENVAPEAFTDLSSATFFNNFTAAGAPLAPAIRSVSESFQFKGSINGPAAGNSGNDAIMILPPAYWPAAPRIISVNLLITKSPSSSSIANPNYLFIDAAVHPVFGVPGAVYIGVAIPASDSGSSIWLDGVIFAQ